jgi:23S rRNA (adenine2030-N6)-methyltransferase
VSDYDHRHHAGNHADVLKHTVLLSLLAAFKHVRTTVIESHAGRGRYRLGPTGEWTAGWGRLAERFPEGTASGSGAVDRYLARVRRLQAGDAASYPGSPRLALDALGRNDRLRVHELDPDAAAGLAAELRGDARARVVTGDGWAAAVDLPREDAVVVVIDPPFSARDEWATAAETVAKVRQARADAAVLLWYPVKRWSRPNTLHGALERAGVPFTAIDLVVTPLEIERKALAGSGVVLVGAPTSVVVEVQGAVPVLGAALATHGRWSARATG